MKILKCIVISILALLLLAILGLYLTGNEHVLKGVANTYLKGKKGPSIDEHEIFHNRPIANKVHDEWTYADNFSELSNEQSAYHEKYGSVAFVVVHKGKIVAEKYWDDYEEGTISNSFSMSKSIVSLLAGIAIDQGKIKSLDDKVSAYISELKGSDKENIKLKHLITMTSGIDFGESYSDPFGFQAKTYYGDDLFEKTLEYPLSKEPGSEYLYQGGNTLLLAKAIENAVGKPISEYAQEMVWQKIGAEHNALWNLDDEDGFEKASCCFYATARDFARLGELYLCHGMWKEEQVVSSEWVQNSIKPINVPDTSGANTRTYGYQWWLYDHGDLKTYSMRGMLGQYVIVLPEKEIVIVRLGRSRPDLGNNKERLDFIKYVEMGLELSES
ncbi:MAG: serine hydrolase [Flavobacteriales bacterium]|nr:serine hydrolase [Flavobacteriales bacterium]